ncbi:hypothetical protein H7I77_20760 [Mycolicibacterium novocastrense]|uniref:Gp89 n=1 Tax=Mycolicibacterium novocastrense TaxID=59813 RepID=A0AAW5SNE6_MYCNV|nr:hypothetical protein [Mycolicibacterium novocastrense]MCV7025754.1 hypothetical protein [Mycolicibacterium novocastrense]GAT07838.1 Gp89 [Mycolicibacterium novocastrense]
MAKNLEVDSGGLRSAAASSARAASEVFSSGEDGSVVASRPSGAGITALDAAAADVRAQQAHRIVVQADMLSTAGAIYDRTDGGSADAIATVEV